MRFEKVSLEQYRKATKEDFIQRSDSNPYYLSKSLDTDKVWEDIQLPKRATRKSAGYDLLAPYKFSLYPGETIKIATGIRVLLDDDKFLMCAPRSGHGFKARIQLDNTIGVIDADYSDTSNEGHIMLKLTNDSRTGKSITVEKGAGMAQAIIVQYFLVEDDITEGTRNGGFGSTDKLIIKEEA